jgi:hypothetical protein
LDVVVVVLAVDEEGEGLKTTVSCLRVSEKEQAAQTIGLFPGEVFTQRKYSRCRSSAR